MRYCNSSCNMYDAVNGVCCAVDEPRVQVKLDEECFFDAHDRDHPHIEPQQTNADYIRSMTDEELAATLMCPNEMGMAEIPCDHSDSSNCFGCLLDWLRQLKEACNAKLR